MSNKRPSCEKGAGNDAKKMKIFCAEQMFEKLEEIDRKIDLEVETLREVVKELRKNADVAKDSHTEATQKMRDALKTEIREELNTALVKFREEIDEETRDEFNDTFMSNFSSQNTPDIDKLEEELKEARNRIKALEEKSKTVVADPSPSSSRATSSVFRPGSVKQGVFNVQGDTKSMFFAKIGIDRDGLAFLTHYTEKDAGEDFHYRFEGEFDFIGKASRVSFNEDSMTSFCAALVNSGSVKPNKRAAARDFFSFFKNSDGKYSRYYPIADEEKMMESVTSHFPSFENF